MRSTPDYRNSRFIDFHKTSKFDEVDLLVQSVLSRLPRQRRQSGDQAAATQQHLKTLLLDLYEVSRIDETRWLGYSRDPAFYRRLPDRYNALEIKRKRLCRLVDDLHRLRLIDHKLGFRAMNDFAEGRLSRIRARPELLSMIADARVKPYMVERCDDEELIVLRARKRANRTRGDDIDYKDTPATIEMRANLKQINRRLAAHFIDLFVPDQSIPILNEELKRRQDSIPFEPRNVRLRRIFNNGSFEQGGRFYGGWWQQLPNRTGLRWRSAIRIDCEATTEIDYSGMHLAMLYAKEGESMPDEDPYELDGHDPGVRDFMKVAVNTMLNADNETEALKALLRDARDFEQIPTNMKGLTKILAAFAKKHHAISKYFYSGYGVSLQYLDSQIAERVMLEMFGIIVLPVHDSFIVRTKWEDTLHRVMLQAYSDTCDRLIGIKFSNPEKHLEIIQAVSAALNKDSLSGYEKRANDHFEDAARDNYARFNERPELQRRNRVETRNRYF